MTVWRIQLVGDHDRLHDTFVEAELATPAGELEAACDDAGLRGRPLVLDGRTLAADELLGDTELEHGSRLGCGRPTPVEAVVAPGRHLVVVSGPDAGRHVPLVAGHDVRIGRTGELALHDPFTSAHHCTVVVGDDHLVLRDAGSTNGTTVEGCLLEGETELTPGVHFQVGSSVLTVVSIAPNELAVLGKRGPERVFARQFRTAQSPLPKQVEAPRAIDTASSTTRSTWWRALLPLVTGAGMAAITGRWIFLLVMAVAPIVVAVDAVQRKRRMQREREARAAEHAGELDEFRRRVTALRRTERTRRRDNAVCGGGAVLLADARHRRLWERSTSDPDFLSVAVGLAAVPSDISAHDPDGELSDDLWGTPLETNLLATGSLAVVGPVERARAVTRSLLVSLAASHSPTELHIWLLTREDTVDDWELTRWLPHTFNGDHGCHVAVDDHSRAGAVKSIKQLLDTRAELDAERPMPVHLVVIDGTDLLAPGELADLLANGPARGIVGLTIDPRLAPEGIGARLSVGEAADTGVFQSRHQPRTEGVVVPELSAPIAAECARRLAALRPMRHDDASRLGGTVHLVDLVDGLPATVDGRVVTERWEAVSPNTAVVVGSASDVPMVVDLVRDGPHGLVGGTSGSGKTEFLKSLIVALCLDNHPDDLSIVIVDFKGGVDHDAVRPIPHVVDVATNLDIEQFRRTIVLLKAESRRRQDLLASAGASNLDAYRIARHRRPDLPPLPRLLVIVDEFSELLASEGGREQLKELESITRIGRALALNLLLVTQNFEGSLPAQIDANAGLRVCLRVGKPAHSKAVLSSGIAATIPDHQVGRAYARFHGRELIEFQTARVAGRRRDLAAATPVEIRLMPFEALAAPPPERRPEDVPVEETDIFALVAALRQAAAASGWHRSAVPWPAALPESISVSSLVAHHDGTGVPVAVMDLPETQERRISTISDHDEHVVLVGGPNAAIPEVLAAYVTSLALLTPADDVHVYGIDLLGRSLGPLEGLSHCGGIAVRNEALGLRIVRHLVDVAAERKVAMASSGSSTIWEHSAVTGELPPQVVLLVSGADRLLSSAEGAVSNLLGPLTTLINEAVGVRVQVVLGGLPRIASNRLAMNIERRFVFQLADVNDYAGVGANKTLGLQLTVSRRAVEVPAKRIVQFAQLAAPGQPEGAVIQQVAAGLDGPTSRPPRRFADVSWPQPWDQAPLDRLEPPGHLLGPLPVGIDTQSGDWSWIDAVDDGPVFAVAGPPKSGRSMALAAMARLAHRMGWSVLDVTLSRRSPLAQWSDPAITRHVAPGDLPAALEDHPGNVLVLLDDFQRLTSYEPIEAALAHRDRALFAVSGPADLLGSRIGILRSFPMAGAGILLAPTGSLDGGAIGLRRLSAEMVANPRPGRGILAVAGEPSDLQVPLVDLR